MGASRSKRAALVAGGGPAGGEEVVLLPLGSLRGAGGLRAGGVNKAHVLALAELEGRWPPIVVAKGDYAVIDGQHRVAAARQLGLSKLAARLFDGGPEEAYVEFVRCNVGHGLPLSLRERERAVLRIVGFHPEWSDRRIGELCGVSPKTVARIRSTAAVGGGSGGSERRVGRDGRVRPLNSARMRARVAEALRAQPETSLRAIALQVGVSPETVRSVRASLRAVPAGHELPVVEHPPVAERAAVAERQSVAERAVVVVDSAAAAPTWRADPAFLSRDDGRDFLRWFQRTSVKETDQGQHVGQVPLSRVYTVADEARRRAAWWSNFALQLEGRTKQASRPA